MTPRYQKENWDQMTALDICYGGVCSDLRPHLEAIEALESSAWQGVIKFEALALEVYNSQRPMRLQIEKTSPPLASP